jgi:type II secretory pathway pseudopilin PulG
MDTKTIRTIVLLALLLLATLPSACGGGQQVADEDQLATQVAEQIYATLTAEARSGVTNTVAPSPTELPPTSSPTVEPSPTASATRAPTRTPTKRPPTRTPRPTPTPTPQPAVGDVVRCGNLWEASVLAPPSFAKQLNVIDTLGYMTLSDTALAKGEWMLLYFTLTNLQSETSYLASYGDELVVQGNLAGRLVTFEPSSWGTSRAQREAGISNWNDEVPPGITITAVAIFDVNPDAEEWALILQPEEGLDDGCLARIRLDEMSSRPMASVTEAANLRSGPGKEYPVVVKVSAGLLLEITGRNEEATWWQARYGSQEGWIATSLVSTTGLTETVPIITGVAPPPTKAPTRTPAPPTITPTPFPKTRTDQEFVVQIWGLRLYEVKKAKAVYFFGDAEVATGMWLIPLVEFRNAGSGTAEPYHNLDFYLQDARGRKYEFDPFNDAVLGAAWQFQVGHLYDDINPGLKLGIALPFDVPADLGDVWLRVEQDKNAVFYIGNVAQLPETQ